jgi:hypothetical protein
MQNDPIELLFERLNNFKHDLSSIIQTIEQQIIPPERVYTHDFEEFYAIEDFLTESATLKYKDKKVSEAREYHVELFLLSPFNGNSIEIILSMTVTEYKEDFAIDNFDLKIFKSSLSKKEIKSTTIAAILKRDLEEIVTHLGFDRFGDIETVAMKLWENVIGPAMFLDEAHKIFFTPIWKDIM